MAEQVISLGSQPFGPSNALPWTGSVLVDPELVEGGVTAYLRYFTIFSGFIQVQFGASPLGAAADPGPDLTPLWEGSEIAIALVEAGGDSITIKGPANPDGLFTSTTDPYLWQPDNSADMADWVNGLGTGAVTLTLNDNANAIPALDPVADQPAELTTPFSLTLDRATDGDPPLTYTASPLPPGLSFDAANRTISGTPTELGTTTVIYTVTDVDLETASVRFDIAVRPAPSSGDGGVTDWNIDGTEATGSAVIPARTFTLPAPDQVDVADPDIRVRWDTISFLLDPELVDGRAEAYLRRLILRSNNGNSADAQRIVLQTTSQPEEGSPGSAGPDLTAQFEGNWAMVVDGQVFLAEWFTNDTSEPYTWFGNDTGFGDQAARDRFRDLINDLATATSVTLTLLDEGAFRGVGRETEWSFEGTEASGAITIPDAFFGDGRTTDWRIEGTGASGLPGGLGHALPVAWAIVGTQAEGEGPPDLRGDGQETDWRFRGTEATGFTEVDLVVDGKITHWQFRTTRARGPSYAIYRLEVDWEGDGNFNHALSNVWADVVMLTTAKRGRNYEDQVYGRSEAGLLRVTLRNETNLYNRFNPASPLRRLVVPGRRVRLMMRDPAGGAYEAIWGGSLFDIEPMPRRGGRNEVVLLAYGPLFELTQQEISVGMQTAIVVADATERVLDEANVPAQLRGPIGGDREMARWWSPRQRAIEALRQLEETELGFLYETRDGRIAMEAENFRLTGAATRSIAFFNADGVGDIPVLNVRPIDPAQDIANIINVPVRTYLVGGERVLWTLRHTVLLEPGEELPFVAQYPLPGSPTADLGVDRWTPMAANVDYTANSSPDGTGANLTTSLDVTTHDTAVSRRIVVRNRASSDLVITRLQARGRPLSETEPTIVESRDDASIQEYKERTYLVPAQFISTIRDAQSYGTFLLSLLKGPQTRARLTVDVSGHLALARRLDLSDRVTLQLGGESDDMFIEGMNHRIRRGGRHIMELLLSPADPFGAVIIIGVGPPLGEGVLGR